MTKYMQLGNNDHSVLAGKNKENKYEFDYDKNTYNIDNKCDSHASLARAVRVQSKVLDVGCSTGKLGSILKDFKNCSVDGIEYEKAAFNILKNNKAYDNVYNLSILDKEGLQKLKNLKYDYVIFGDVLEHLIEPWIAILNACELLKEDGSILVSVPNIAHIDIIKGLINNDFNYNSLGLLDNTHVRFFTENSFVDMIKNINKNNDYNLSVKVCDRVIVKPEYLNELNCSEINDIVDIEKNFVLQIIFKLTKVKDKKSIKYEFNKDEQDYFYEFSKFIIEQNKELQNTKNELKIRKEEIKINQEAIEDKNKYINDLNAIIKTEHDKYQRLDEDYTDLNSRYQVIVNSKGWKMLERFRKTKRKIIRK